MNPNIPPTPPPSPAKSKDMERMENHHSYAFAHWCDTAQRWIVSPHYFIVNVTTNNIIGQFITTDWFSCYIYPQKTFLVVQVKKGVSTKQLEKSLNSPNAADQTMIKNIESFITRQIEQYAGKQYTSIRVELIGLNSKNTLSLVLKETHHYQTRHSFYCTLPSFCFKN